LNLQQDSEEPYDACPYCLTKIVLDDEPTIASAEPETFEPEETKEAEEAEIEVEEKEYVEEPAKIPETPSECRHYLGYLSEKSAKEQIPDECMMCKDIVSCMLKKMKE
jgi:DNA-directed RNA polymerase subunit RPC12/RpoP